jgi:hypothetical protein
MATAVVPAGGARVGVAEGVLDVLQRGAEAEGLGGVGVPEAVRGDAGGGAEAAAAIRAQADLLASYQAAPDTLLRWARVKSLYAQEPRNGRQVIVRPDTLAGLLQCGERTVQRCNAAAREIGLELVVTPGRMLSELETYAARRRGSPQRGLSTVTAFVVPTQLRSLMVMTPLPEVGR